MKNTYRSIFISDVHLGTRDSKAELLTDFLKNNSANTIYLVGDIIDGWRIQQNRWKWKKSHTNVVRQLLNHAKRGSRIIYIAGNHDEFLRPLIPYKFSFGKIEIANRAEHIGVNGERYLVIHGDMFDGITKLAPWLGYLGDKAYDLLLYLNTKYNWLRHKCGFGYWSFSKFLKHKVKGAVDFIFEYEDNLADYARRKFYDGVICGHIHFFDIKMLQGIKYINCGDFVESCSVVVENFDGSFEIITMVNGEWTSVINSNEIF
jgi:UDP-2,3-diacylglucosamine pyrophosphatase LpxH